jgi:MFS family permease
MIAGGICFASATILNGLINHPWQFYLTFGCLSSIGTALILLSVLVLLGNSFPNARGTALGFAYAGMALGQLVMIPTSSYLIEYWGWRLCYLVVGAASVLLIPIACLLPDQPAPAGKVRLYGSSPQPAKSIWRSQTLRLLALAYFSAAVVDLAVFQHSLAYLMQRGLSSSVAAWMLAGISIGYLIGQLAAGALSDRFGRMRVGAIAAVLATTGILALIFAPSEVLLGLVPACCGLGVGAMINVRTSLTGDLFAGRDLGKANGILQALAAAGAALITWFGGRDFDVSHSYQRTFELALFGVFVWLAAVMAASRTGAVARVTSDRS